MKDKIKGLVCGILIGVSLVTMTAYAATSIQKELHYKNIKITLDGNEIKPTDATGAYVEPFIIDGTTYLPVRGVANALGLGVEWNANENTVELSSKSTSEGMSSNVLYNSNGIKITYAGIGDGYIGKELTFLIENNSSEPICVQTRDDSVNGYMVYGIMSTEVQVGKKANGTLTYMSSELEKNGISEIEEIELYFHIFNNDTWDTIVDTEIVKIIP